MSVKIVPQKQVNDQYISFEVQCDGIPTRVVSVNVDAIADGKITIEGEVLKATESALARLRRVETAKEAMRGFE